ncbi:unnamed protein product [Lota lota]
MPPSLRAHLFMAEESGQNVAKKHSIKQNGTNSFCLESFSITLAPTVASTSCSHALQRSTPSHTLQRVEDVKELADDEPLGAAISSD